MKKLISILALLSCVAVLANCGCGNKKEEKKEIIVEEVTTTPIATMEQVVDQNVQAPTDAKELEVK